MRLIPGTSLLVLASCTLVPTADRAVPTSPGGRAGSPPAAARAEAAAPATDPAAAPATDPAPAPATEPAAAPATPGPGCEQPKRPEPRLTTEERDCGPAADHCLRPGTWFAETTNAKIVNPTFECGGRFYEWQHLYPATRASYRTRAARDADIAVGARVIYYVHNTGRSELPLHEHDAHNPKKWQIGVISKVYADRRYFELDKDPVDRPFESARVIVETR